MFDQIEPELNKALEAVRSLKKKKALVVVESCARKVLLVCSGLKQQEEVSKHTRRVSRLLGARLDDSNMKSFEKARRKHFNSMKQSLLKVVCTRKELLQLVGAAKERNI